MLKCFVHYGTMILRQVRRMGIKILIVEDDVFLREGLTELLTSENYIITAAENVKSAKTFLESADFDLVILDVRLPDGNGLNICREIRAKGDDVPVLFLTACDDENEIIAGLDSGADDYVTKPFGIRILLSRIRALLRRNPSNVFKSENLFVDMGRMIVKKENETVFLTPTEFQILGTLIKNSGKVVTRSALLSEIWDIDGNFIDDNTLSVHISRLREKIGAEHFSTVRGVGYRWEEKQ